MDMVFYYVKFNGKGWWLFFIEDMYVEVIVIKCFVFDFLIVCEKNEFFLYF